MGLTETVLLIVVLVVAAMALIVVEICTPTFGLLAILGIGCVGGAVYLCYTINGVLGVVATVAAALGVPLYSYAAVKILPKTRLGRVLMLRRKAVEPGEGTPEADELAQFVGRRTTAETVLRPSGMVRVDGRRIVARAESGMIDKGQPVRITEARGNYVIVRKVES